MVADRALVYDRVFPSALVLSPQEVPPHNLVVKRLTAARYLDGCVYGAVLFTVYYTYQYGLEAACGSLYWSVEGPRTYTVNMGVPANFSVSSQAPTIVALQDA